MKTLWQDVRYGLRMMRKHLGFTVVALLTLAAGIGATSAIFSVVNAVLLRPLSFREPDRLVFVEGASLRDNTKGGALSPPDFLDYREQNQVFDKLVAFMPASLTLTGPGGGAERISGTRVSAGFFEALGVAPLPGGRTFLPEDEQAGRSGVALISHGLWRRRFASDPKVIGQTLSLNGETTTIVGIMPADFQYPQETELWVPLPFKSPQMASRRAHFLWGIGSLKPGVTLNQAQADMNSIAHHLEGQYPESNTNYGVGLTPLQDKIVGETRSALLILLGAVIFLLLIACANVANLSLVRSASRFRELSIRVALGASRARVVRQLLTESVVLALVGGAMGLCLAMWGTRLLVALGPETLPRAQEVTIDARVLGFTLLVSLMTGVLFGIAPALTATQGSLSQTLKEGRRGTSGLGHKRLRSLLVASEITLSLILLIGAGLFVRSFQRLSHVDPGFRPENVLTMQLSLTRANYPKEEQRAAFFSQLLQRIGSLSGVQDAGAVSEIPLSGQENDTYFSVEGEPAVGFGSKEKVANRRIVSPGYFRAMGIPVKKGRSFTDHDVLGTPKVIVVSESFVSRFMKGEEAIGKQLSIDLGGEPFKGEIVGVVGSILHSNIAREPGAEMYVSYAQAPPFSFNLIIHTAGDPAQLTSAVRREVQALDKDVPIYNIETMSQRVWDASAQQRFRTLLLASFAVVALLLASIGIYGVLSYSVAQRTNEIGIRMALGAGQGDILKLVIAQGMKVVLIGIGAGLPIAWVLARLMKSFLFEVSATDPAIFAAVTLLLALLALLACYLPARKAARVNPLTALRYE